MEEKEKQKLREIVTYLDQRILEEQETIDRYNKTYPIPPNYDVSFDIPDVGSSLQEVRRQMLDPHIREQMAYEGIRRRLYEAFPELKPQEERR